MQLLTVIERQQEEIDELAEACHGMQQTLLWWITQRLAAMTIGSARLNLAERRIAGLQDEIVVLYESEQCERQRAEKAEAAAEHHRETIADLRERLETVEAELAAERGKRCATCREWGIVSRSTLGEKYACTSDVLSMFGSGGEYAFDPAEDDFWCSEWQRRDQVPNVAQQGSERDADGTGEAADGNA